MTTLPAIDKSALVLSDATGNLYILPRDLLAKLLVPESQKAQIQAQLEADDTNGYLHFNWTLRRWLPDEDEVQSEQPTAEMPAPPDAAKVSSAA